LFQNVQYGVVIAPSLLIVMWLVWWHCIRGLSLKVIPFIILSSFHYFSLEDVRQIEPRVAILGCTVFLLATIILFRLVSLLYFHKVCKSIRIRTLRQREDLFMRETY